MDDRGHAPFATVLDLVEARRPGTSVRPAGAGPDAAPSGALGDETAARHWTDHVAHCATCQERMRRIAEVLDTIESGDAGDAPESWIRRAEMRALPQSFIGPLRGVFVADVVFDSAHELLAGTRAGVTRTRQIVFASNRLELEMAITPGDSSTPWALSGQVFSDESVAAGLGGCEVVLLEEDRVKERAKITESGEFVLRIRPGGRFHVRIEGGEWTLETPAIDP
jgi:hypothetical protein